MGLKGPVPRDTSKRSHRSNQRGRSLEAGAVVIPTLPDDVSDATIEWWQAWIDSPQVTSFTATDWQALKRGAALVEMFYAKPTAQLAAEIRQVEAKVGGTVADRDRLGMRIDPPRDGSGDASGGGSTSRRPDPRREAK